MKNILKEVLPGIIIVLVVAVSIAIPISARAGILDWFKDFIQPKIEKIIETRTEKVVETKLMPFGATICFPSQGCTGTSSASWTGIPYISAGTWQQNIAGTTTFYSIVPNANNTYWLGTSSARWAKGYFQDLDAAGVFTLGGSVGSSGLDLNGEKLILDNDGDTYIQSTTTDDIFRLWQNSTNTLSINPEGLLSLGTTTANGLFYAATSTPMFTILQNGNVGIGTTGPAFEWGGGLSVSNSNGGDINLTGASSGTLGRVLFTKSGAQTDTLALVDATLDGTTGGYLGFSTQADGGAISSKMVILGNGNVGIGTTTPKELLHLYEGNSGGTADGASLMVIEDNTNAYLTFLTPSANKAGILWGDEGSGVIGQIIYNHSDNHLEFTTNATEQMRITSAGNVGIGTTTPSELLTVWGGAYFGTSTTPILYVASSTGRVGIGTSSPSAMLNIGGNMVASSTITFQKEFINASATASTTINWNNGQKQYLEMNTNAGISFTAPTTGVGNFLLRVKQNSDATGTITFYESVYSIGWPKGKAPTQATSTSQIDIYSCYFNNPNYYCTQGIDFR